MAKFLDKKEQVIDFKLTSYGRYLLSIGSFKPSYYAFFDNNIMYDTTICHHRRWANAREQPETK